MNVNADVQEIIEYLESNDLEIVNYFKNTVQEKLYASRDHNLLGAITDRYIQTKSDRLLELLISINDTHAMYLFDKLNDHLKHGQLTEVCTLLFSIVRKQNESDIVFIMSGIIILCTLIPCIPAIIRSYHGDILEVFVRTAGFILNKSGQIPEVCILHLHIGVYILFHRLYAMYPNNFLSYMKSCFAGSQKKDPVFQLVIKPMFEFVKFHPDLITETPKSETGLEKWKVFQPHDVLADCQKISLDPVDSVKEANYAVYSHQVAQETSYRPLKDSGLYLGLSSIFTQPETDLYITPIKRNTVDNTVDPKPLISDNAALCNPSDVCGLTTPPCSRQLSPSNSTQDLSSLYKQNHTDVHLRDSISNLNELPSNRKSSSDTASVHSNTSPGLKRTDIKKTQSFGSSDNVNHKNLLKSWLPNSASHSTPVEKELLRARQSAPASPKRGSINKGQQNHKLH
ncbi:hamartin-like [Hydractinia symbiolongicarpus]|uniref:hamartin-like n=1 Tax=Hydractinia symbiolongicarpus TaxID=13093 RepID=UPI00254DE459|nr:hamartin-like [Hydractinia symbiolongicarpus]